MLNEPQPQRRPLWPIFPIVGPITTKRWSKFNLQHKVKNMIIFPQLFWSWCFLTSSNMSLHTHTHTPLHIQYNHIKLLYAKTLSPSVSIQWCQEELHLHTLKHTVLSLHSFSTENTLICEHVFGWWSNTCVSFIAYSTITAITTVAVTINSRHPVL